MKKNLFLIFIINLTFVISAYSQFGKNIVQYQEFKWKYIETKHFDIYYNIGSKNIAEFTAIEAEKALKSIRRTLNYSLNKRIKFIIYNTHNEFQQTNVLDVFMQEGIMGVTELMKNRIVIPFQGSYSQFRHTVHHELVHGVMNDMFYGGTFQTALQSGNLGKIPIWISEGLAEFESIGGYNTETDMFMRDVSLNEKLLGLKKMQNYYAYRGGQSFFWYVAEKYGRQRVGDLINRLRVHKNLDQAFKSAFNMNLDEFSKQFVKDLKKYYWPDIAKYEEPTDFSEQLTNHEKEKNFFNSSPAISPDGKKMAYISAPGGIFSIFIRSLDDEKKKPKKIISSFRQQDFEDLNILTPGISWNPKGTKLAISAKSGGEDAIFIVDIETQDYEKLKFNLKSITSVSWSHDSKYLAFIGSKNAQSDLYIYSFEKKDISQLTNDVFSDFLPVWDYKSENVYFLSDRDDNLNSIYLSEDFKMYNYDYNKSDVYKINISTETIERITNSPEHAKTSLAVSSNNKSILFSSDRNGIYNIYKLNLEDKSTFPITNSLTGLSQLSLSPDDSKLLISAQIDGGFDIFLMRFPFERKLDMDTLSPTKFRNSLNEKLSFINDISKDSDSSEYYKTEIKNKVYGNFELEFSRQEVVKPNIDAEENIINDANETLTLNDSSASFIEKDYKITFTPDFVTGNPGYSTFWGFQGITQMLFSDVLGDHKLFFQANLLIDLVNSTFYAAYLYQPNIVDYTFSLHHAPGIVYYGSYFAQDGRRIDSLYRFRDYGASISASYPFDLFNRIEWGLGWKNISKERIQFDNKSEPGIYRTLFIPQGRFVHDDVIYGYFGPVSGSRYNIGFLGTPKFNENSIGFLTLSGDIRHYIKISDYSSIALRGAAGTSMGPNPQNFYLGGTDFWINSWYALDRMPFDNPEDVAFLNTSFIMPLRGFGVGELIGNRYFLTNLEFRFPFIAWFFATPIPIVQSFMGAVFFDMAGAWSGDWSSFQSTRADDKGNKIPNNLFMSSGVGLRTAFLGIPLKIDVAWVNLVDKWSEPRYLFSLGYDF